jgi:hypothetical protein
MPTNNRPFQVVLAEDIRESFYKAAASVKEGDKAIQALEDGLVQVFDEMVTEYKAAPATGDWIEFADEHFYIRTRTVLAPGGSGHVEIHLRIERAPSAE